MKINWFKLEINFSYSNEFNDCIINILFLTTVKNINNFLNYLSIGEEWCSDCEKRYNKCNCNNYDWFNFHILNWIKYNLSKNSIKYLNNKIFISLKTQSIKSSILNDLNKIINEN